jgi:DNA invertase Pin-like site-specific DNA recombinase
LRKNQFESSLISQRVKASIARTKAQSKHIALPPIAKELKQKIIELQPEEISMSKISKTLGIAYGTFYNYRSKNE